MRQMLTGILVMCTFTFAHANEGSNSATNGNGNTSTMPKKVCYVDEKPLGVLMDYYQCKEAKGSHKK